MKLPEEIPREALEFLARFGGATVSVLEQLGFEYWWNAHPEARDKFPYTRPFPDLPMYHDLLVSGGAVLKALVGLGIEEDPLKLIPPGMKESAKMVGKVIRQIGEGGVLYTAPMLVKTTAVNFVKAPTGAKGAGTPGTRGRVINL